MPLTSSPSSPSPAAAPGGRAEQRPPLPQLDDLTQFCALVDRQLGQCRRLDLRASVMLIEVEPQGLDGGVLAAETAATLQQAIGARLSGRVRGSDVLARVGGRQFGLVLVGAGRAEAETVRARLHKSLGGPYGIGEARLYVGLHMGVAVYRESGRTARELTQAVEQALRLGQGIAAAQPLSLVSDRGRKYP